MEQLIKAFLVGMCAEIPIGPVAILIVRNSLSRGHGSGFVTALGSTFVDTIYSIIAIFALAFAQRFIDEAGVLVLLVGGVIVALVGTSMAFRNPFKHTKAARERKAEVKDFLKAAAMGFSNPGAVVVIFALMAFFGLGNIPANDWRVAPIIISVCLGSAAYWFTMTMLLSKLRSKISIGKLVWANRIMGLIVLVFGIIMLGQGLFDLIIKNEPLIKHII